MGIERGADGTPDYHLVSFDARANERPEGGALFGTALRRVAAETSPTDIFLLSHGWNGDVPAARDQYGRWVGAMAATRDDEAIARCRPAGFLPLVVGVHWPSKAWGDEELSAASFAVGGGEAAPGSLDPMDVLVGSVADSLGDSPAVRASLRVIADAALRDVVPPTLPDAVREAYQRLDAASGLAADGEGAAPGDDRDPFDAESAYQACLLEELTSFGGVSLGGLLAPLRILTFWHMKRRANRIGAVAVAALLADLQAAAPSARVHLMGHSFGCIVVSSALAAVPTTVRPVQSLMLAQGAMSHWAFCASIPAAPDRAGYFRRVVTDGLVRGPTVVTTSVHDRAVRTFYPLGAGARRQVDYDVPGELPKYGAIGTFGVQGPGVAVEHDDLHPMGEPYDFRPGTVYNLRADDVIIDGGGATGAHNDIAQPEVAQVFWQASMR